MKTLVANMVTTLKRKVGGQAGETLVESMASLLVASMAIVMLVGAIATSARMNHEADETRAMAATLPSGYTPTQTSVTISYDPGAEGDADPGATPSTSTVTVNLYDADGLYYYEPRSEGSGS